MKRIVVGIKDPANAAELITWTAYLASSLDARPIIVHAVHRSEMWVVAGMQLDCTQYVRDFRRRLMHDVVGPLLERDVDATARIAVGEPARALAETARRENAGVILIGSSARAPMHEMLSGSVGHRLEHLIRVPLVVVPASSSIAA
jgi:nucleotide-binding universal stress UspA family protein